MDSHAMRRKTFSRVTYGMLLFIAFAILLIGAHFDGDLLGISLKPFVLVFAVIELAIVVFIAYSIMQDEKLEQAAHGQQG